MPNPHLHILLVEDDEVDTEYIRRCLDRHQPGINLVAVSDATAALNTLRGENGYARLPDPFLILLTLHLPGLSGLEFLRLLRNDPVLRPSIVFVLDGPSNEQVIAAVYEYNVAGYLVKDQLAANCKWLHQLLETYRHLVIFPNHMR